MKLVIFLLFALTFAFAEVTVKEVNNCYKLNVAKKCPSDDKVILFLSFKREYLFFFNIYINIYLY